MSEDLKQLDGYQDTGADWLAGGGINGRAALGDDPGLGKTAQTVRAFDKLNMRRGLVVCPAAVKSVWVDEFDKWGYMPRRVVPITEDVQLGAWLDGKFDVAVVSYEYAKKVKKHLETDMIPVLVFDEFHYLKTPTSARTRRMLGGDCDGTGGLINAAAHTMSLSGTFMMNTPLDIWTVLRSHGAYEGRISQFEREFFELEWNGPKPNLVALPKRLPELREIVSSVILRRDKRLLNLPPLRTTTLDIQGDQSEILALLREYPGLDAAIMEAVEQGSLSFLDAQHIGTLRRLTAEAKAPGFGAYLLEQFKGGLNEAVVIGIHVDALRIIKDILEAGGVRVGMLTGSTPDSQRGQIVRDFQAGALDCVIGNVITAGTGHTMTRASTMYMFETDWVPFVNVQCLGRIHRKGQMKNCLAYFVGLANSVDQKVTKSVQRKVAEILKIDPTAVESSVFAEE